MTGWHFTDSTGSFVLENPHRNNYLYFPLVNEAGMMSSITPLLHGDAKTGQNSFLLAPVSVEDLHNSRSARNFWVVLKDGQVWSATGNAALQIARTFENAETVTLEAGFLWHQINRENAMLGIRAQITNFVPPSQHQVELMRVTLTNISDNAQTLTATAAVPIFGRSADNLRDHRHVTSLLHRITTTSYGILVRPTLSFDERGHRPNAVTYGVLGVEGGGAPPIRFFPLVEEFIGEGGCLEWPEAVVCASGEGYAAGQSFEGYEAIGGLRFREITLMPGQTQSYILILAIMPDRENSAALIETYGSNERYNRWLRQCQADWQAKVSTVSFNTGDARFDGWMKWVTVQPVLRRLFGNSFLPYHDYGRGGRGWRDLWQDCLALLMMEPGEVRHLLFNNYAGVRIDGSNATIIGSKPGEFIADRNNIPRVWMDHGAWPFLTTKLYLDQSGDLPFLLQEQNYFKDMHIHRACACDGQWTLEQGTLLLTEQGKPYQGTILEHILVQHLTAFFHVGEHNIMRLEGADWNDGLDMARERGESVAFTALYAGNLRDLSDLVLRLETLGITEVELAVELLPLLDTLHTVVDYTSVPAKHQRLQAYFATCEHTISGEKRRIPIHDLARDLRAKADWLYEHIREQEWITNQEGYAWFNGYYDNDGSRVEGDHPNGVRMTLTGQVFTLMSGIATDDQAVAIVRAADHYLFDASVGGYRLNSDFGGVQLNLGRCFGFAYGHKENGAMFSHMAVMFANALYRRGLVHEGFRVLDCLYRQCENFAASQIYPGIPEYISARGRGMYTYLTGSASWLLLTLITEVFGVKGVLGDLVIEPKLVSEQFDSQGKAGIFTLFAGRKLKIRYRNLSLLDYGTYTVRRISLDGTALKFASGQVMIPRHVIQSLDSHSIHDLDIELG